MIKIIIIIEKKISSHIIINLNLVVYIKKKKKTSNLKIFNIKFLWNHHPILTVI